MGAWPSKGEATPAKSSPWSCLKPEILHLVLRRLSSDSDRVRFAAVCHHWRAVADQFRVRSRLLKLPLPIAGHILRRLPPTAERVPLASVCSGVARQLSSPWSDLPPELACLILRRLTYSYADRVRFAAVCRHWRYVARVYSPPLPRALPWIYSSSGFFRSLPDGEVYVIHSKGESSHGSFGNWLLFKEIVGNNCSLKNPFTGETLRLPTHCKKPAFMYANGSFSTPSIVTSTLFSVQKAIVCKGDLIFALVRFGSFPSKEVVCCRPGMSSWLLGRNEYRSYQDMAVHLGKLYAVANGGDLFYHEVTNDRDTGEPKVCRIEQVIQAPGNLDDFNSTSGSATYYLVKSITGKLLLVRWFVELSYSLKDHVKGLKLTVFEADFERSLWVEVERLDDQVLFVSSNCSKTMSASTDDDYLQANKIYIVDRSNLCRYFSPKPESCTCWVYDMCSKLVHPVSLGQRMNALSKGAWFFP